MWILWLLLGIGIGWLIFKQPEFIARAYARIGDWFREKMGG